MDRSERKRKRESERERERERKREGRKEGERVGGRERENAFIYIYEIVDDAMRGYVRFEMHKEPARGRGINLQREGGRGIKMAATFV